MKRFLKSKSSLLLASVCLGACLTMGSGVVNAADYGKSIKLDDPNPPKEVQIICDQKKVSTNASIPFQILYHNIQNKNHTNVFIKIKVPEGLDIDPEHCEGAEWDVSTRTLLWNLKNVSPNFITVIHFQLKVTSWTIDGTKFDLSCFAQDDDGDIFETTPPCTFTVGSEIDQPFFNGYPDGNFHPTAFITRAEAATVVARSLHLSNSTKEKAYWDVTSSHWAYSYINEVSNAGFMHGYPDGSFHPDAYISRAELVTLLLKIRGIEPVPAYGFSDTNIHWAKDQIGTARALGYIDGIGSTRFEPDSFTKRQEAAKLFDIALYRGPLVNGQTVVQQHFPDVPKSSWAFGWVEEGAKVAHQSVREGQYEYLIRYLP